MPDTEKVKSEQTSFVDKSDLKKPDEVREMPKMTIPEEQDPFALLKKMDRLIELKSKEIEVVQKNTDSLNALISTLVAQVRKDVKPSAPVTTPQTTQPSKKPETTAKTTAPLPEAAPVPALVSSIVEQAMACFKQNLTALLLFTDEGDYVKIKPKQYLGSDNFAKIASTIREVGGEYVSAGKDSHFRLPKSALTIN